MTRRCVVLIEFLKLTEVGGREKKARVGAKKRSGRRGTPWGLCQNKSNTEGETQMSRIIHGETTQKWTDWARSCM